MFYEVKPEIAYCVAGRTVILLDIEEGRYFRLPEAAAGAFIRLLARHGELAPEDEASLASLLNGGLLTPVDGPKSMALAADLEPARSEVKLFTAARVPILYLILTAWCQMAAAIWLRYRDFQSVLKRLKAPARMRPLRNRDWERRTHQLVTAFERADSLLGRTDRCLVRSVAMASACRRLGISAQFVIGVRSEPFVAHCWVQRDDTVLNDTVEHVRTFTPILVLR